MKAPVNLIRAIGVEFVARKLKALLIILGIAAAVLLGGGIWLTTISVWWWLLTGPIILLIGAAGAAYLAALVAMAVLRPALKPSQAAGVSEFVDKLERVVDGVGTPMPFIVLRVAFDIGRLRGPLFLRSLIDDSATLHKDFLRLVRLMGS